MINNEKGVQAVELALLLPIFLGVVFGVVDFGMMMRNQEVLTNASREGARAGIMLRDPRPTEIDIINVVNTHFTNAGWDPAQATVTVTGAGGNSGDDLSVAVTYNYTFHILSSVIPSIPDTLPLSSSTTMKLE